MYTDAVKYLKLFQRTKCRKVLPGLLLENWVLDDLAREGSDPRRSALSFVLSIFEKVWVSIAALACTCTRVGTYVAFKGSGIQQVENAHLLA